MNTLAEQYQIMRDLENLLGAKEVPSEPRPATVGAASGPLEGSAPWRVAGGTEGGGRPVMAMPAYPPTSQDPLFGEAA